MINKINRLFYLVLIIASLMLIFYLYHLNYIKIKLISIPRIDSIYLNRLSTNAKLVDLSKPLEPWSLYQNISCQETKSINSIQILMCLYDSDNYVSYNIRKYNIYEQDNIGIRFYF